MIVSNLPDDVEERAVRVSALFFFMLRFSILPPLSLFFCIATDSPFLPPPTSSLRPFASQDLFLQTVGPVSSATLAYNSKGKSTGVATVIFRNKGDAQKAFDMYNNRMIDQS